jgi:dipeptidyl aminopeptidase/acylaminoacyl peptidase
MSPTGGAERPLAELAASPEYGLAWSPDGRRLAAVDRSAPGTPLRIVLLDAETGVKEPLTSPGAIAGRGDARPIFSPDGRAVAFKRSMAPTAHFLCVVPAAGGEPRQSRRRAWSRARWLDPDGEEIVFTALAFVREGASQSCPRGQTPALRRSCGGSPPTVVRPSSSWAARTPRRGGVPGGHRLAFTQQTSDWDVWRIDLRGRTGRRRPVSSRRPASTGTRSSLQTRSGWRSASARTGVLEIWVADDEGGNPQRLTFSGTPSVGSPRWSPDGRHIAFDYLAEGDTGATSSSSAPRGPPPGHDFALAGREAELVQRRAIHLFRLHRSGEWQVGRCRPRARRRERPIGHPGWRVFFIESPDGEHLYFGGDGRFPRIHETPSGECRSRGRRGGRHRVLLSSDTNWDVTAEGSTS